MTPNTSLALEGAAYIAGFLFLAIAITCYVYQLRNQAQLWRKHKDERNADYIDALLWRRLVAVMGTEASALRLLRAAEDLPASTDDLMRRGFRMAARNGLLMEERK